MPFHQETIKGPLEATACVYGTRSLSQMEGNSSVVFALLPRCMVNAFDVWLTEVISLRTCSQKICYKSTWLNVGLPLMIHPKGCQTGLCRQGSCPHERKPWPG